jgi:hypothetical protein
MTYAIVHKNRVIVGPMLWAQKYFTDVLKIRHKITANIPGKEPNELPFVINDNTKIHRAIDNKPDVNNMIHCVHGPFWDLSGDVAIANYEIRDLPIETARNNFRQVLAAERYKREVAGIKTIVQGLEISLSTSREYINIFVQKLLLMSDDEIVSWKFPEGWLVLTKQDLAHIVQTGARHIQNSFDWEREMSYQIDTCTSLEKLLLLPIIILPTEAEF